MCVKQVTFLPAGVVLEKGNQGINPLFTMKRLNDPDRYAVEEAIRLSEEHADAEVLVVTVGEADAAKELRKCLAMGAHRAVRVSDTGLQLHDPISVGRALAQLARRESADIVLCGVQSEDACQQATGPVLASALGYPCVTMVTDVKLDRDRGCLVVQREVGGGMIEVAEVDLPAVLTVQTGINSPRTGSMKAMMTAKRATIEVVEAEEVAPSAIRIESMAAHVTSQGQLQLVEGGPAEVAKKIRELIEAAP